MDRFHRAGIWDRFSFIAQPSERRRGGEGAPGRLPGGGAGLLGELGAEEIEARHRDTRLRHDLSLHLPGRRGGTYQQTPLESIYRCPDVVCSN